MFERYWLSELKFIKIRGKNENHDYVCVCREGYENVYVPSLHNAFAPYEIQLIRSVEADDLLSVPGLKSKVRFEVGEFGEAESYFVGNLSNWDVKNIENVHNKNKKPPKKSSIFNKR
jgi:hypothetical protein